MLDPKGAVGAAEKSLIATSTWAMLIVVVPVILLTLLFAWRYRASNRNATYAPKWAHSTAIEIVIWTVPSLIILFLGILTWQTTRALDPYRPLESSVKPINVEGVALDIARRVRRLGREGARIGRPARHDRIRPARAAERGAARALLLDGRFAALSQHHREVQQRPRPRPDGRRLSDEGVMHVR
ncbi:ubiquinol oxidase, subunit II [Burkholderia humptydooensis MSMB43]|uniref:Ubiquinol oxidase, subunit II n=1 Tax=Burkholderia humptydooensis MSMB43 TaxID=441157 RepID=A0ABN0G8W6_9BURK|nr:ubiquinol oxidase, subunit II [Burkholderia humptydooensis MSMB43]